MEQHPEKGQNRCKSGFFGFVAGLQVRKSRYTSGFAAAGVSTGHLWDMPRKEIKPISDSRSDHGKFLGTGEKGKGKSKNMPWGNGFLIHDAYVWGVMWCEVQHELQRRS